jgi:hypothetical protein
MVKIVFIKSEGKKSDNELEEVSIKWLHLTTGMRIEYINVNKRQRDS